MALDERYILGEDLGTYFVDKDTGEPLANGKIYFYEDENRNTLKQVYELTGSPPNYTFSPMANPVILSSVGRIQDDDENDVAIYYYPYDDFGNVQNYYVAVYDADSSPGNGTPQFTREAWPNVVGSNNPTEERASYVNMLTNPQFHDVNFDPTAGLVVSFSGNSTTSIEVAPGWVLDVSHTGAGTITIGRTSIAGTTYIPTNPAYTLDITPGVNISLIELRQRLTNNPAIWGPISGNGGYLATSLTCNTGRQLEVIYRPSSPGGGAADQEIFSQSNTSGAFSELTQAAQLTAVPNSSTSDSAYADIVINVPITGQTRLTSVQVVSTATEDSSIVYRQEPVNRLKDYTFNYYKAPLNDKPIPSELVGWDFPLNPSQLAPTTTGPSVWGPYAVGANKSSYVWDQTIVFQTVDSGFSAARTTSGSLEITIAQNDTQVALVQYLTQEQARELLSGSLSVHIAANKSSGATRLGTVSLWWTTGTLPDITAATYNSIVLTLDANGKPATQNGTWNEVERDNLGDGVFYLGAQASNGFNEYGISGWSPLTSTVATGYTTATYFAIVVGFEQMDSGEKLDIQSISLCKGRIATKPAPKTPTQVLKECQRFFEMSYSDGTEIGTATSNNALIKTMDTYFDTGVAYVMVTCSFSIEYKAKKSNSTPSITLYNTSAGGASSVDGYVIGKGSASAGTGTIASTQWTATARENNARYEVATLNSSVTENSFAGGEGQSGWIKFQYVVDSRLGTY